MNVLIVDRDKSFADVITGFLKESSIIEDVCYLNPDSSNDFKLSEDNFDFDISFVSLDSNLVDSFYYISQKSNLIGISPNASLTRKYINNPIFKRIFQKPVDIVSIVKYLDFQYGFGITKKSLSLDAINLLSNCGFGINYTGTLYLAECIVEAKNRYYFKFNELATIVGKKNNVSTEIVIWSIRNAINRTLKTCGESRLLRALKIYDDRRPTAKYIIEYMSNLI